MTDSTDRVLAILTERDVTLPDDGLTLEKIRDRGTHFHLEEDDVLGFRLERHPTMYLSDSQLGHNESPARFHVVTEYRLELDDETWHVDEREATFEFDPHLIIEAELDALGGNTQSRNRSRRSRKPNILKRYSTRPSVRGSTTGKTNSRMFMTAQFPLINERRSSAYW